MQVHGSPLEMRDEHRILQLLDANGEQEHPPPLLRVGRQDDEQRRHCPKDGTNYWYQFRYAGDEPQEERKRHTHQGEAEGSCCAHNQTQEQLCPDVGNGDTVDDSGAGIDILLHTAGYRTA